MSKKEKIEKISYICEKCDKNFINEKTLKLHTKTSDCEKKKQVIFRCEFCDKKLASKQMLKYHLTICSDKKVTEVKLEYEEIIANMKAEYNEKLTEYNKCTMQKNCKYSNGVKENGSPVNCIRNW